MAEVSKVAPIDKLSMSIGIILAVILLKERPQVWNWVGIGLISAGLMLISLTRTADGSSRSSSVSSLNALHRESGDFRVDRPAG